MLCAIAVLKGLRIGKVRRLQQEGLCLCLCLLCLTLTLVLLLFLLRLFCVLCAKQRLGCRGRSTFQWCLRQKRIFFFDGETAVMCRRCNSRLQSIQTVRRLQALDLQRGVRGTGHSCLSGQQQQHRLPGALLQCLGSLNESRRLPGTGIVCGNGICPVSKTLQCLSGQLQQRRIHGLLFCQPGIEKLLHGPGCGAKLVQTDHARTALERVERPAQSGLFAQVARLCLQDLQRCHAVGFNLAHLFQKDLQQFIVHGQSRTRHQRWRCLRHGQYRGRNSGIGRFGLHFCTRRNRGLLRLCNPFFGNIRRLHSLHRQGFCHLLRNKRQLGQSLRHLGQGLCRGLQGFGFHCQLWHVWQVWQVEQRGGSICLGCSRLCQGFLFHWQKKGRGRFCQRCLHQRQYLARALLAQQVLLLPVQCVALAHAVTPHQGAQFAQGFVVDEQLAGQCALVAQHVHHETQGAQAVAQFFKGLLAFAGAADLAAEQVLDRLGHARHCQRCLVQTQHRQHAAHLSKKGGDRGQRHRVLRVAKELVHGTLGFA